MGGIRRQPGSNDNVTHIHVLQAFGGGLAGGVMRSCTHPLDVLKLRMQMQVGRHSTRKYRGILHGIRTLYVEEGMRGLVRGHNTSQVMGITQGLVQFWSYEQLSALSRKASYFKEHTFQRHFLCGGIAGCFSCTAAYPFDVVRAQVMASDLVTARSMIQGFRHVYAMKGWNGFTRGLPFALIETFPLMGFKFLFYKYLNALTMSVQQKKKMDIHGGSLLVNAAVAGGTAKIVVYPVDLLKKRIQLQTFKQDLGSSCHHPHCPTFLQCIVSTLQNEGVRGFYKGLTPTVLRSMLANAIYFSIYDLFSHQFIDPLQHSENS
ncbi:mitochondrial thiamine pyrophosphate carrier-like [Drosophila serrata]|uniref:mitochondrial thiamine pyrophosphate carrier-like n=1 Tax=Drosophila serrata TaxID=7274 RepID=UPI000A1D2ECA|nr:mitochondrial thiamine pyrophosphate carrier-like [Drosophila serrata]